MKRILFATVTAVILLGGLKCSWAKDQDASDKVLAIREAKQVRKDIVAVEGYLNDDILEVAVEVRMYGQRPKIINVALVGPGVGRLSYSVKEEIPVTLEEEDPYEITKEGGLIKTSKRTRTDNPTGALTKELFKIKVPSKKIITGKKYQLWVDIKSKTQDSRPQKFKFDLKDFPELIQQ
jgi:hypothetical protein